MIRKTINGDVLSGGMMNVPLTFNFDFTEDNDEEIFEIQDAEEMRQITEENRVKREEENKADALALEVFIMEDVLKTAEDGEYCFAIHDFQRYCANSIGHHVNAAVSKIVIADFEEKGYVVKTYNPRKIGTFGSMSILWKSDSEE